MTGPVACAGVVCYYAVRTPVPAQWPLALCLCVLVNAGFWYPLLRLVRRAAL